MYVWPSDSGFIWLLAGFIPVALVSVRVIRFGIQEVVKLSFLFVVTTWLGYHLTPLLALRTNGWDSFLLIPDYVSDGLMFSTLAMALFLLGYYKININQKLSPKSSRSRTKIFPLFPLFGTSLICGLALLSFLLFLFNIGGPNELWQSSYSRGEGQFNEKTFWFKFNNIFLIAGATFSIVLAFISSVSLFSHKKQQKLGYLVSSFFGIVVATLPVVHSFSRVAGYVFLLTAIMGVLYHGARAVPLAIFLVLIAGWLSWTGYTQRGNYSPGIGTFIEAAITPIETTPSTNAESFIENPGNNPFNALDSFTARAWTRYVAEPPTIFEGLLCLLASLQPIPSHIVPISVTAGEDLAEVMGTIGSTGLTTPAHAELYYWLGMWGVLALYPFGHFCRWIDWRRRKQDHYSNIFLWAGTAVGFVIGLHSGVRAMTRLTIYSLALIAFIFVRNLHRKRIEMRHCL